MKKNKLIEIPLKLFLIIILVMGTIGAINYMQQASLDNDVFEVAMWMIITMKILFTSFQLFNESEGEE